MPRPGHEEVLLVTGYPAFGARQLVAQILRAQPTALVHALVEREQADAASEHRASLDPASRGRLELLEGSVTHIDLGLTGAEVKRLSGEVDRIHHTAQLARLDADRTSAERVNIRGTLEALELARHCRHLRAFVHHSTAFVAGNRRGTVREEQLDEGQGFRNHVEATRKVAEELVRAQMSRLPVVVVRPSLVVGDSQTGEIDRLDGPYFMMLLALAAPGDLAMPLPRTDVPLHLVPVDYVAAAAHALGRDGRALGRTFHLVDPRPLTARRVFELLAQAAGRRTGGTLPANLTKALLRLPGLDRLVRSPRSFLEQLVTPVRFDDAGTAELLAGTGIQCPPFESYAEQLVAYVRSRVLVAAPVPDRPSMEVLDADDLP